jgi:hypothetical protein
MRKKSSSGYQLESDRENYLGDLRGTDLEDLPPLLETAGIPTNISTVHDLYLAKCYARHAHTSAQEHQNQPMKKLLDQLDTRVARMLGYLRRVKKHVTKNIGFQIHPLESDPFKGNIFKAIPMLHLGKHKEIPTIPEGAIIFVDIEKLLCDWQSDIRKLLRTTRGRGKPKRQDKYDIVFYAAEFFCKHSILKLSNDANNPFHAFAEQFYETVTGTRPTRSLDWQIRKALKALGAGFRSSFNP